IHRKVHARLLFAAYLSPTDFILLERIESKFLKAILQQAVSSLKQCVIDVERQLGFLILPRDIFYYPVSLLQGSKIFKPNIHPMFKH
ncbi:hypothetical protein E2320_009718, partial [Naja naja]